MAEWAELFVLKDATLQKRLNAYNWPIHKALTEPLQNQGKSYGK